VEALIRKPLNRWTTSDVRSSIGAWKLLNKWPKEQLVQLQGLYSRCWGPDGNQWSDEQPSVVV